MTVFFKKFISKIFLSATKQRQLSLLLWISFLSTGLLFAQHSVDTDRENANYLVGETVNFQINSTTSGTATYEIIQDKYTAAFTSGTLQLQAGQTLILPFTPTDEAVLLCKVKKDGQTQIAAASISPFSLAPVEDEPERFDAFWEEARNELADIPIDPELNFYNETEYSITYRINIATIDNRRVYGYISIPKMEGPFPGVLTLPAYGSIANVVRPAMFLAEQAGALSISISIHNTEPDTVDPNAYKPNNIMNEYTNYYRYAVLACIRAIDYLHTRADFNGELAVSGVSQGGGLSLMTAGLDERVDLLVYSNASHCEHAGKKYEEASGFPYYLNQARLMYNIDEDDEEDIVQACKYYDAIYFARRYDGPSLGFISYQDEVSPPTTTFKAFNNLKGMKVLMHGKVLKHEHPQEYWVGRYDALRRFLPSSQRAPWPYARNTRGYLLDIGEDQILEQGQSIDFVPTLIQHEGVIVLPAEWEMIEGPAEILFSDKNSLNTTATFSTPGTYRLKVRVWDEALLDSKSKFYSISDDITVVVHDGTNLPLLVDCPESITLFTSTNTATTTWALPNVRSSCNGENPSIMQTKGLGMGSDFPAGRTLIEYRITDACGQETTCGFSVTVLKENFSPLNISCPENIVIYTDNQSAIGNWDLPNVLSACNTNPITYSQVEGLPLGSTFPLGDTQISYEVTDACGQEASCSFTVSVIQQFDPLLVNCSEDLSFTTDSTALIVNWDLPEIISACNNEIVQIQQLTGNPIGTYFPIGDTEISYEMTDACGQKTTCAFTITVIQVDPLLVNCSEDLSFITDSTALIVNWDLPEIISACNNEVVQIQQLTGNPIGTYFPIGDTEVSYEMTDACGQKTTCAFTITVIQVAPLLVNCSEDLSFITDSTALIVNWDLPEIISACNNEIVQIQQLTGNTIGTYFPIGDTEISYEMTDACGQKTTCAFTITVIQEFPPLEIVCPINITLFTDSTSLNVNWELPEIISACRLADGIIFDQIAGIERDSLFPLGQTQVSYNITDACGQQTSCDFIVTVIQNAPPLLISCPENQTLSTYTNLAIPTWDLPQIISACEDDGIQYIQTNGPNLGNPFPLGDTEISYLVRDFCGQEATCSFMISIIQTEQPTLEVVCPEDITLNTSTGSARPDWNLPEILSSCGEGIQYIQTQGPELGSVFRIGETMVEYEVMDGCEQIAYCTFMVNIIDTTPPALNVSCPFNISLYISGQDTTVTWDLPEILSACNEEEVLYTQVFGPAMGEAFPIGNNRVTYKIEDACEQVKYCSFIIEIIQGELAPLVVECPENVRTTLPFGRNSLPIDWISPEVTSFCSDEMVVSQIQGPPSGSPFWKGMSVITYLIQDGCGNQELCSFEVEILEATEVDPDTDEMASPSEVNEVIAYPNPTNEKFILTWQNEKEERLKLEVINLLGQVCHRIEVEAILGQNDLQVDMKDLAAGCYFWRLTASSGWSVARQIVKQ